MAIPEDTKKHNASTSCNTEKLVNGNAVNNNKNIAGSFQLSKENMKCDVTAFMIINNGTASVFQYALNDFCSGKKNNIASGQHVAIIIDITRYAKLN